MVIDSSKTEKGSDGKSDIDQVLGHTLEHFRAIVQSSDDAIISKSLDGLVTSWNSAAEAMFGYTEDEMVGRPIRTIFPPERIDEEAYILAQIGLGEKVDHFETERLHKNGSRIQVSVTISPIRDRSGEVVGASKIARDISHRVKLEASQGLARAILLSTDDAVVAKSLDGIVTEWNPGAQRLFGYTAQEMVGSPIRKILPADRQQEEDFILDRICQGIAVDHFETVRQRKDGQLIEVSVTISPIRDSRGKIIGASKIARDITNQKTADAQLRLAASVFTSTGEGILIISKDGFIADVNQAFTAISGYSSEDVLGREPQTLLSNHSDHRVFQKMRRALMHDGRWKGEFRSNHKNNHSYAVSMTVSQVFDAQGMLRNYVALFSDITPLKLQQEQLKYLAHYDPLTHLPNRLLLADRLQQAMANCVRRQEMLAVLYMDIDGFKVINDQFGHSNGDGLLVALARQMTLALRESDTIARMGGDEFVVVLAGLSHQTDADHLVQRLLAVCAQPIEIAGHVLNVTISIGMTLFPNDPVDAEQLMRHADYAMYEAKRTGNGRYRLFDAAQEAQVKHVGIQQTRLAQALERQEFVLHYQPKVNMRTGVVIGAEALIRWQHLDRGLLFPGAFLPFIEKHALSGLIGKWVLETVLQQMSAWQRGGLALPVSINIAASQFQDAEFPNILSTLLSKFPNVVPSDVELEILETSALEDVESVQKIIHDCQKLGVQFSLDDFGTGYSTLTYLKRLRVKTLKIDQSFIREMLVDAESQSIVRGVIGLAKAFDREVIAEGVETDAHGVELLALGCDLGQGYAIAKAMPVDLMRGWIDTWRAPACWVV